MKAVQDMKLYRAIQKLRKLCGEDYIVEQGTAGVVGGVWNYRKWNSGIAECWTTFKSYKNVTCEKALGATGFLYTDCVGIVYPQVFDFLEAPTLTLSIESTAGHIEFASVGVDGTLDRTGTIYVYSTNSEAIETVNIHLRAIGRWK